MSGIMYRNTISAVCVFALLSQCSVALAQSRPDDSGQQRHSVLKRNKQDDAGVQLNAPKSSSESETVQRQEKTNTPKTIKNPYVSEFNPSLELMDARPIGSAAIPETNQSTQPSQRTPGDFVQSQTRRNNSYTSARLTDQVPSTNQPRLNSQPQMTAQPGATVYRDVEETPRAFNTNPGESALSSSSHFSIAQLEAKVTGPASLLAGQYGQYNILVRNVSPSFAENTELYVDLPKGSRVKADKSFRPQQTNTGIVFKLGNVRPNQPLVIPFQMSLPRNEAVQLVAYLRFSGSTEMTVDVAKPSNSTSTSTIGGFEIAGSANAALRETLTYAIMVTNTTTSAGNFTVRAKLPTGLNLTVLDRDANTNPRTGLTTWSIQNLAPGETEIIQFKATATATGKLTIVADALSGNRQIGNHSFTTTVNR